MTSSLDEQPSPNLLAVNLSPVPLSECRNIHKNNPYVRNLSEAHLCAGDKMKTMKDTNYVGAHPYRFFL